MPPLRVDTRRVLEHGLRAPVLRKSAGANGRKRFSTNTYRMCFLFLQRSPNISGNLQEFTGVGECNLGILYSDSLLRMARARVACVQEDTCTHHGHVMVTCADVRRIASTRDHTYTHAHIRKHAYSQIQDVIGVHTCVCKHVHTAYTCLIVCIYIYIYVCIYIYMTYVYMYYTRCT